MDEKELLHHVDHTCLAVDTTWEQIKTLCQDGLDFHVASVCIPPAFVKQAAEYVDGRLPIGTVVGFPNGYQTTASKVFETQDAIQNGASEVDMVIPIGLVKMGAFDQVEQEIALVKEVCKENVLKVIIEACMLTEEEKCRMCEIVTTAGADYIKTSTGFGVSGATKEDVLLFAKQIGPQVKIKAAGGIRTVETGIEFLQLGADRIGSSGIVAQIKERRGKR